MDAPNHPRRTAILVVEDEPLVRIFMADFLEDSGFKVSEAVNADEAIPVLQAHPDVQTVITDIEMPGPMSGLKLAKIVHMQWPRSRIVATSGGARPGSDDLSDGAAFLAKPYRSETIIPMVQQTSQRNTDNCPSCARSSS